MDVAGFRHLEKLQVRVFWIVLKIKVDVIKIQAIAIGLNYSFSYKEFCGGGQWVNKGDYNLKFQATSIWGLVDYKCRKFLRR